MRTAARVSAGGGVDDGAAAAEPVGVRTRARAAFARESSGVKPPAGPT